jgi:hypothetical protein
MDTGKTLLLAGVLMSSACSTPSTLGIPSEVLEARARVESLLARHGFTCAGHPNDADVEVIRGMDTLFSAEQIVELRRCEFSRKAIAYQIDPKGNIVFLFRDEKHGRYGYGHVAALSRDGQLWANESYVSLDAPDFTRLPSAR